jgi:hypothetical protein
MESVLEGLIDRATLTVVLKALVEICQGKADHVATNWQDESLSRKWSDMADRIDALTIIAKNKGL